MSLEEFIKMEATALSIVSRKDSTIIWKAVECGAMEKVRLYAESLDYDVTVDDLTSVIWTELLLYGPNYVII